ncbi:P-loop containing nucleoside triphosphate hydrolase protein [Mucidula mucida]|nr:P-loop containing nucleoside triphosphate hydrolase protein [Mucidula mucida]
MNQQFWTALAPSANATSSTTLAGALPVDLSSLFRILTSFSTSREGSIVMVVALLQYFRRFPFNWTTKLYNKLFLRLSLDDQQACYQWMLSSGNVWVTMTPMPTKNFGIYLSPYHKPKTSYKSPHYRGFFSVLDLVQGKLLDHRTLSSRRKMMRNQHDSNQDLLEEARKEYLTRRESRTDVYTTNDIESKYHCWQLTSIGSKRGLDSIILEPGVKSFLLKNAQNFLKSKQWYADRGIPFRRGYLLYGAPGSGKTSFICALAGELGLDIYSISLSHKGLDDMSLAKLLNKLPEHKDKKGKTTARGDKSSLGNVTLSGLLNALDGVDAKQGRILVATTNKYDSLDEALSRPGRMDPSIKRASSLHNPHYAEDSEGCVTKTTKGVEVCETSPVSTVIPSSVTIVGELSDDVELRISMSELRKLADAFADLIPENEVSMASLQGYLMEYKTSPGAALAGIEVWVEKQRRGPTVNPKDQSIAPGAAAHDLKSSGTGQ